MPTKPDRPGAGRAVSGVPAGGELARRLGTFDAVVIGLGSMVGAGVFAAFTPAAQAAGGGLLVGLAIAALVAFCNATSSAQLAAQYPTSGGTYVYGRQRLGDWPGFLAGWGFVIGKTASCAAMALTFAAYVAPDGWARPVAAAVVVVLALVNCAGVTRTALLTRVLVSLVL
ncbi:MAG: APC family permease, partial [Jatrophihabitantaceae bacterium]